MTISEGPGRLLGGMPETVVVDPGISPCRGAIAICITGCETGRTEDNCSWAGSVPNTKVDRSEMENRRSKQRRCITPLARLVDHGAMPG